jgi:hypothetical protein
LGAQPEVFPKQPRLTERVKCGNWLRLPGQHHTKDWSSRAFNGVVWLDAAGTVDHILSIEGDSPRLIPPEAREFQSRIATVRQREQQPSIVQEPINDTLLTGLQEEVIPHVKSVAGRMQPGQRNNLTFELYQRVLSTPLGLQPLSKHLPMFQVFDRLCRDRQRTQSFHECWNDYCRAADYCRVPWSPSKGGGPLERAIATVNASKVKNLPRLYRMREPTRRLAALCQILGHSGREFGLPQETLASLQGVSQQAVSNQISGLLSSGFIRQSRISLWTGVKGAGSFGTYLLTTSDTTN